MKINCIYCKTDFICEDEKLNNELSIVKCGHCQKEWDYENQFTELEKRIEELDKELNSNENRLTEEKKFNLEKISTLETLLKNKKIELDKKKTIESKLYLYEQRLTRSEKENVEQAILEDKIFKLREEINENTSEILIKTKEIDKKINYLMMKTKYENKTTPKLKSMNEKIPKSDINAENVEIKKDPQLKKYNFWKA
jgi:predicted Zn finger-like uncharacterized protein